MTYQQTVHAGRPLTTMREPVTAFEPGQRRERDWYQAPGHAGAPQLQPCASCRTPEISTFGPASFGDSEPDHWGDGGASASAFRYHRDAVRSATLAQLMVPEEATYRIEYDATRAPGAGIAPGTEQRTTP